MLPRVYRRRIQCIGTWVRRSFRWVRRGGLLLGTPSQCRRLGPVTHVKRVIKVSRCSLVLFMWTKTRSEENGGDGETHDNIPNDIRVRSSLQVWEEQARKVCMESFISRDQLIRECQTRHEAPLLEPENRCKRAREEDSFYCSEGDDALAEGGFFVWDPGQGPLGFACDRSHRLDGVEELDALGGLANVCVDEEGVDFGVDVFAVCIMGKRERSERAKR